MAVRPQVIRRSYSACMRLTVLHGRALGAAISCSFQRILGPPSKQRSVNTLPSARKSGQTEPNAMSGLMYQTLATHANLSCIRQASFVRGEVSTNAVEGLFSRVKRFNRIIGVQNICKSNYGDYLGEFLWRERNLSATALGVYISILIIGSI